MLTLRRHFVAALGTAVIGIVAGGCGSVAPVDVFETHEASASALRACTASASTICQRAQACSPYWFGRIYTSLATCSAVFGERCVDRYRGEGAATEIADCSSAILSLTCDKLLDPVLFVALDPVVMLGACPVTPGVFTEGDRCLRDGDCTTGRCAWKQGHAGCGTCVAPIAPLVFLDDGAACASDNACASRWCASGTCRASAGLGEACADRPCDLLAGATCGSDAICRAFGAADLGQACSWTDNCVAGAECQIDSGGSRGTCKPRPTAGVGEDCTLGCASELTCVRGKCAPPTPGLLRSCAPEEPAKVQSSSQPLP